MTSFGFSPRRASTAVLWSLALMQVAHAIRHEHDDVYYRGQPVIVEGPSSLKTRDYQVRFVDSPEDLEQVFSQDLTSEDPKQCGSEVPSRTVGAPCAMNYAAQVQAPDPHNPADALTFIHTAQGQASEPTVRTPCGEACLTVSLPSKSEEPSESDTLSSTPDGSGFTTPSFVDSLLAELTKDPTLTDTELTKDPKDPTKDPTLQSPRSPTLTELMASCSRLPSQPTGTQASRSRLLPALPKFDHQQWQRKSAPPEAWLWQRPSFDKSCPECRAPYDSNLNPARCAVCKVSLLG